MTRAEVEERQAAEEHQRRQSCSGYRGDPSCKVCEGSGYVYGGTAALVVYRREVV